MQKSSVLFLTLYFNLLWVVLSRTRLTWVNGIGYGLQHMEDGKKEISKLFGGKAVSYCHNPTSMVDEEDFKGYIGDLTQAGTQLLGKITQEVNTLAKHLKEAVAAVGREGRVVHIAHSQGALLTALAAKQLSPLEMSQIEVLAFGGAAAIRKTPDTPFHRCVNYYAVNDPLLFVVPSAEKALRSGYVADEEFCFLAPLVGDPSADHGLLNPTYVRALSWEGQKFQRNYQSLVYRSSRSFILFCLAVIKTILLKIRAAIKFILHSLLFMREWLSKIFEAPLFQYCHDHFLRPLIKPVLRLAIYVAFLFEKLRAAYETLFNSRDVGKSKIASGDENNAGVN